MIGHVTQCPSQRFALLVQQAARRRLDSADVMLKGPQGVMKYRPLHAQLVGRRCRMATMLGNVYSVGPQTGKLAFSSHPYVGCCVTLSMPCSLHHLLAAASMSCVQPSTCIVEHGCCCVLCAALLYYVLRPDLHHVEPPAAAG